MARNTQLHRGAGLMNIKGALLTDLKRAFLHGFLVEFHYDMSDQAYKGIIINFDEINNYVLIKNDSEDTLYLCLEKAIGIQIHAE